MFLRLLNCTVDRRAPRLAAGLLGVMLVSAGPAVAQDVVGYRQFAIGSSVNAVTEVTRNNQVDVTVVHQRPRLLQELVWRPRYTWGGPLSQDAVREIQFRFLDDELYSMVVRYDAHEIEGLTADDLIVAISEVYGPATAGRRPAVAHWEAGTMRLTLFAASYPSPYQLAIVVPAMERDAQTAAIEAQRLDRVEAPAAAAAQRASDAAERRVEDAVAREKNKGTFRP